MSRITDLRASEAPALWRALNGPRPRLQGLSVRIVGSEPGVPGHGLLATPSSMRVDRAGS
jgi:hypothetical protein